MSKLRSLVGAVLPQRIQEVRRARRALTPVPGARVPRGLLLRPRAYDLVRSSMLEFVPAAILAQRRCFVDVGAYRGSWSTAVLSLLGPERVVAIEPSPESFRALREALGSRPEVTLHECAVGAAPGEAELHVMSAGDLDSLLPLRETFEEQYRLRAEEAERVRVPVRTLDELLAEEPEITVLKLDVQGSEEAALAGAADTLRRTRAVLLETNFVSHYDGDLTFLELARLMSEAGFELYSFVQPMHVNVSTGQLLFADAVFVHRA